MRACGHVATYIAGCRCEACTEAHTGWHRDRRTVLQSTRDPYQLPTIPWQGREWYERASCRGHPHPEWWFPFGNIRPRFIARAVAVCESCPVRSQCAEAARSEQYGIWAGEIHRLSPADRRRYFKWKQDQ